MGQINQAIAAAQKGANALEQQGEHWQYPFLKELVIEASQALAHLDAERLEELALSCQALNRDLARMDGDARKALVPQAKAAVGDLAVFGRVLEATRSNLDVMQRLRERRLGQFEYRAASRPEWRRTEIAHGDN
jgi:aminopeptidase N